MKIDPKEMYLIMGTELSYVRMGNNESCEVRGLIGR
jgi:hypothetical protein